MKLTSKAVVNGYLDPEYGINTKDESQIKYGIPQRSFPLEWDEVPEGTESFAIICMDYDNVEDEGVPWVHWLVSDIDKDRRSLEDNEAAKGTLAQGMTSWALPYGPYEGIPTEYIANYGGPAPGRTHEYEVEIFALDIKPELETGFYYNKIRKSAEEHALDKAVLRFLYKGYYLWYNKSIGGVDMDNKKNIITISREFGSGGRLIGKRLAEKLGVPYYDKELLDRIAEESGFCREMMEDAEKKAKNSFLYSLASALGTGEAGPESLSLNERFFLAQFDTIKKIADEGSCVIVGRCADYILRGMPEATNVFIYAEEADKIKRAVQEYGVPEDSVKKMMKDTDKARANYYAYHTGRKWGEHVNYHLAMDSGYLEIEDIVDIIIKYTEVKLDRLASF